MSSQEAVVAENTMVSADDFYAVKEVEKVEVQEPAKDAEVKTEEAPAKAEDDKAAEAKPAEESKPDEIKLELPENALLSKEAVDSVVSFAKEHKLPQDVASKILNRENEAVEGYVKAQVEAHEKQVNEWVKEVQTDPELGGEKFKESAELSKRVVERFGSPKLVKELNETGYGNHPELVRLLSKIGRKMGNDTLVNPSAAPASKARSLEDTFYGNSKE